MAVKLSAFFPSLNAYFNGKNPSEVGGQDWDMGQLFRFFIADKLGIPVFAANPPVYQEWIKAYIFDQDKVLQRASAMTDALAHLDVNQRALYEGVHQTIKKRTDARKKHADVIDGLVKENFKSKELDSLVAHIIAKAYPITKDDEKHSPSPPKTPTDASNLIANDVITRRELKQFLIDGVLSQTIARQLSPRKSIEYTVNEKAILAIKALEDEAKMLQAKTPSSASINNSMLETYEKFVKEVQEQRKAYELNPYMQYPGLPSLVIDLARTPSLFPEIKQLDTLEIRYGKKADHFTPQEIQSLEVKVDQPLVTKYKAVKAAIGDYLIDKATYNHVSPYAEPNTSFAEFRKKHSRTNWPVPTTLQVIGPRILHPFYLLETIMGGIARLLCGVANKYCKQKPWSRRVLKGLAIPFMFFEGITYGLTKLTTRDGLSDIYQTLTSSKSSKKYSQVHVEPARSKSHRVLPGLGDAKTSGRGKRMTPHRATTAMLLDGMPLASDENKKPLSNDRAEQDQAVNPVSVRVKAIPAPSPTRMIVVGPKSGK